MHVHMFACTHVLLINHRDMGGMIKCLLNILTYMYVFCLLKTSDRLNGAGICPLLGSSTPRYNPVNYGTSLATCSSVTCSEITDNRWVA